MIEIEEKIQDCDVLIVGGGIAGLMAAIAAASQGAKVVIAEKANSRRSGSGATGNDHFGCYIPEVHGDIEEFVKELGQSMCKEAVDTKMQRVFAQRSFEVAKDWDEWGIDMRPHGKYEFNGHALPGHLRCFLKYNGENQKPVLTKKALEAGVRIDNKTAISEFITKDGKVVGAIGIDISKSVPCVKLYRTKSIITATGIAMRLYPSITPGWMFNLCNCPAGTASGRVAAYKAGATLVNIDVPFTHAGPKYMERCGKATWIGVLEDYTGKAVGPFVEKPSKECGDITGDIWQDVFLEKKANGTAPVYMDCTKTEPEDLEYMKWGFRCEGDTSLLEALETQGMTFNKHMVEFDKYNPNMQGRGIEINERGETDLPGLYCAGDECGNFNLGIAGAAVTGRIAGENAASYVQNVEGVSDEEILNSEVVRNACEFYTQLMERKEGATWKELNVAVQQIMSDYCGIINPRSESMLSAGLNNLELLERRAKASVFCANSHELMRALESFDLLEMGKLIITVCRERRESRGMHKRSDYTFTNPLLNDMFMTVKKVDNQAQVGWRKKILE